MRWKKVFHANGNQKKAGVAISYQAKQNLKTVTRTKDTNIMIKGLIQEEYVTIVNIYAPNTEVPQYIRQMLRPGETDSNTVIVEDLNTPLSTMDRSSRQKISKEK